MLDPSLAQVDQFRRLPRPMRDALYAELEPGALATRRYDWTFWARPDQLPPPAEENWRILVFRGTRGTGKTEAAVNYFVREILDGRAEQPAIVVGTGKNDARAIVKRIRDALPPADRPTYEPSTGGAGVLTFRGPHGPVEVPIFSAAAPEGPVGMNFDLVYCDDVAKWGAHAEATWTFVRPACRVGYARMVVATTRRGTRLLMNLLGGKMHGVVIRRPLLPDGRPDLRANASNVHPSLLDETAQDLRGTALGADEVDDEDRSPNSPFADLNFEVAPIRVSEPGALVEAVVAVDPAEGKGGDHDEWGIGAAGRRRDRHVVALEDASGSYDDAEAGAAILDLCERRGATKIVAEGNRGRERILSVIRAAHYKRELDRLAADPAAKARPLPEIVIVIAKEGKRLRGGPVRTLYLDGMLHHLQGLDLLEAQERAWDPDGPRRPRVDDRIDWLVHAAHHLAELGRAPEVDHAEEARENFAGFDEAQKGMPAPSWGSPREEEEPEADDQVLDEYNRV